MIDIDTLLAKAGERYAKMKYGEYAQESAFYLLSRQVKALGEVMCEAFNAEIDVLREEAIKEIESVQDGLIEFMNALTEGA